MQSSTVVYRGKDTEDGSLIEELKRTEVAARAEADRLRARIELRETWPGRKSGSRGWRSPREGVMRVLEEPPMADTARQDGGRGGKPGQPIGSSATASA
jgi:hypothetical protein